MESNSACNLNRLRSRSVISESDYYGIHPVCTLARFSSPVSVDSARMLGMMTPNLATKYDEEQLVFLDLSFPNRSSSKKRELALPEIKLLSLI